MELTEGAVARLAELERRADARKFDRGQVAGRDWFLGLEDDGDFEAAERLDGLLASMTTDEWGTWFSEAQNDEYHTAQSVYFELFPAHAGDTDAAGAFWLRVVGKANPKSAFVEGFARGVLSAFDDYQNALA